MAVRASVELRNGSESRISWGAIRKRRKTAITHRLITVHLGHVGLVHSARANILGAQIDRVAYLVLETQAPFHEIGRVQLSVRYGCDCDWLQTRIRVGQR